MSLKTKSLEPTEDRLPTAHSLREAANADNRLEGYAAMNDVDPSSEIAQAAEEEPVDLHEQTAQLAYQLYLDRGGNHGFADEDWYRAEDQIRSRHGR